MNKVFAEIIAGVIPHKMTRNRWRGILRYGIFNAISLKKRIKNDHTLPTHYLSVCAIAKNEGPYFKEWIEWHLNHGVEKFCIYDNESTDDTKDILNPYIESGIVDYKYWPGHRRQLAAYEDCLKNHRFTSRWIAFIDLDEFIVPIKDASIPKFLERFESFAAVEINWLVYGSSGRKTKTPGTMMERFKCHSNPHHYLNRHVKSIVNPRRVFTMIGCHEAAKIAGYIADSHLQPIRKHFRDREPQQDIIRINHYAVRSYEEFIEKQARGRASGTQTSVKPEYFTQYDLNDIEDGCPLLASNTQKQQVVISMASFPEAIPYAVQAIRSILNGSVLPDKLILYLTFSQFAENGIPESLKLLSEGSPVFEIRNYDRDIRSYRKLIPALIDFPEAIIVTVDDDVAYHRHMLRDLLELHARIPDAVLAHRVKRIKLGQPYRSWKKYRWYDFLFKSIHRGVMNLQTGVGGVLYPPHSLRADMMDVDLFSKIAPSNDDIWFWAAAVMNGFPVIPVPFGHNKPCGLNKPKELSLKTTNFKGKADRNLSALKAIIEHYPEIKRRIN